MELQKLTQYVADLEARVATLETELRATNKLNDLKTYDDSERIRRSEIEKQNSNKKYGL